MPFFSIVAMSASITRAAPAFLDEGGDLWLALRRLGGERMLGCHSAERHAHIVSARVVKT